MTISLHASNRSVPNVKAKRETWKEHVPGNDADNLVFLDESGVNTDMTRHYARAKTNERAVDSIPLNTPCSTTILSSMRLDGRIAHTAYQGGITTERFAGYLRKEKVRIASGLSDATEKAFSIVTVSDCSGWFRSCNYVQ